MITEQYHRPEDNMQAFIRLFLIMTGHAETEAKPDTQSNPQEDKEVQK